LVDVDGYVEDVSSVDSFDVSAPTWMSDERALGADLGET
jgi:hypothetical protein